MPQGKGRGGGGSGARSARDVEQGDEFSQPHDRMAARAASNTCDPLADIQEHRRALGMLAYALVGVFIFLGFLGFIFSLVGMSRIGDLDEDIVQLRAQIAQLMNGKSGT